MIDVGTLVMKVAADTSKFTSGMSKVTSTVGGIAKTAGIAALAVGTAATAIGVKTLIMAADAEEARNKYDVVFAGMTDTVDKWSEDFSDTMGRSKYDVQEAVANLADLQQGLGMTTEESFDLSKKVISLATDLASFNNVQDDVAIDAVSKAMLGEAESAKQLGLLLNVNRVKDFAEAQGLVYDELTDAERAQQVYNLAVTQSQNAIGDAERSSGSYTNQVKKLQSKIKDIGTTMGMNLIPVATKVVTMLNNNLTPAFEKLSTWWEHNGGSIKSKASSVFNGVRVVAGKVVEFYNQTLIPAFQRLSDWWSTNGDTVKDKASEVFGKIVETAKTVWDFFTTYILPVLEAVVKFVVARLPAVWDTFKRVFEAIIAVVKPVYNIFEKVLLPILKVVVDYIGERFDGMLDVVTSVFEGMLAPISGVIGVISDVIDWFSNLFGKMDEYSNKDIKAPDIETPFDYDESRGLPALGGNVYTPGILTSQQLSGSSESVTPMTSNSRSKASAVNININNPSFTSKRDIDKNMNQMVGRLKLEGVNP